MSTKIVNTTGQYGDGTDFSSVTAVIPVDIFGNYSPISPSGSSFGNLDNGFPDSTFGGVSPIDAGGVV